MNIKTLDTDELDMQETEININLATEDEHEAFVEMPMVAENAAEFEAIK